VKVLCYAPYNRWPLHGQWEMTILQGLKQRGADVQYVLCDGLYSDCDVFWASTAPRPKDACVICQRDVTRLVADLGMDFHWLGRYLELDHPDTARAWVSSLPAEELATAAYGDYPVASWVKSSVHSHLRNSVLDVSDPAVEQAWRSYLYSGLVACFALDRMFAHQQPDVLLQFNGRQSSTRVAFELARRHGIRVVCHERGFRPETLQLTVNDSCSSLEPVRNMWRDWADTPLSLGELEEVDYLLREREHGRALPFRAFAPPPQPVFEVREELSLDPRKATWVLFTSSDDEVVAEQAYRSPFPTQRQWIEATIDYVARNPQIELVIRVHPNTGSGRSIGVNHRQLEEMEELGARLPENARMVRATDAVSSYALMELSTVGLVYHSTVGLEMACRGKHMVVAGGNMIAGLPFVHTVEGPPTYEALLEGVRELPPGAVDANVRRLAFRFAYGRAFRLPISFPLVSMPDVNEGLVEWLAPEQLAPGFDRGLDRCVGIVLGERTLCEAPTTLDRMRTTAAEDAFLRQGVKGLAALAYAHELVADGALLAAWGRTFSAADDVTLVIQTPPETTDELIAALGRAGLDREDAPDLVAVDGVAPAIDAVFSRMAGTGPLPRFDDASIDALRASLAA
jgi:hypothetical protein